MWIYIDDDENENHPWNGTITPPSEPKASWEFEVIRQVEPKDLYGTTPFEKSETVLGLLDHQRPCTLIRPLINEIDAGSLGVRYPAFRTRLKGRFASLLSGLAIKDIDAKAFTGASFVSDAFALWYSPAAYKADFDVKKFKYKVSINGTKRKTFEVNRLGVITCVIRAEVSTAGRASDLSSTTIFKVDFPKPVSLQEVGTTCYALENLFGFLIGFRGKLPIFHVWLNETYQVGEHELPLDGELQMGGVDWQSGPLPHPLECVHLNGMRGTTFRKLLERFIEKRDDFMSRIVAVDFSRHFAKSLQESFNALMPVLEKYVRRKYRTKDEANFMAAEKNFFDWVDSAADGDIPEFCRKHVQVKESKSPSLKTLLSRAIVAVNERGFNFPANMAERLQKRRGEMFHSVPEFDEREAAKFASEIHAATGLLMLHTYIDLGIDIRILAGRTALSDLREFLQPPKRADGH
jgi:hypothetical protein